MGLLAVLGGVLTLWSHRAPALQDAVLLPLGTLLLSAFAQAENRRVTYTQFTQTYAETPEAAFPWVITILVGIGVVLSVLALWRSLRGGQFAVIWAAVAAVFAPAMAIILEMGWNPSAVIGGYPWALHAAGLAVLMALFAERLARVDGTNRLRTSFAVLLASLRLLRGLERPTAKVMLDSAAWSTGGLLVSILLMRWIRSEVGSGYDDSHWSLGLNAAIWLGLALTQVQRTQGDVKGLLTKLRWVLASVFGLIGGGMLLVALGPVNPLLNARKAGDVFGPVLVNTLAAAYLLPALVLLAGAWRLNGIDLRLRKLLGGLGGTLTVFWIFAAIRHFWQGGSMMPLSLGISQPEQYTYTIVLLLAGAALFYQSLARRSDVIRKAGLVVIGLAVAKVFLIDVTDLDGLTRVFSLLVLGLALAALAWLNRWAQDRDRVEEETAPPLPEE